MTESSRNTKTGDQPRIGAILKQKREALGWRVEYVAGYLKMRPAAIEALEAEDFSALPGRAYVLGFLKSYASFLGLDGGGLVLSYCRDTMKAVPDLTDPVPNVLIMRRRVPRSTPVGLLMGVGFVVVAIAYAGWHYAATHNVALLHHEVPRVEAEAQTSDMAEAALVHSSSATFTPAADMAMTTSPFVVPKAPEPESASFMLGQAEASMERSPFMPKPSVAPPAVTAAISEEKPTVTAAPAEGSVSHIVIQATQPSWVQIRNNQNAVVFAGILKAGDQWSGEDNVGPYRLTTGNAGGLVLRAGDTETAPLGKVGIVRHDIMVSVGAIKAGEFGHGDAGKFASKFSSQPAAPSPSVSTVLEDGRIAH